MLGENTRRVAKIISFEVSSVNEMIKSNVILCKHTHTHTQDYIVLQKSTSKLEPSSPPPPSSSSFSQSYFLIAHTSFLLFSISYNSVCV
jgi:hypothetical protein